MQPLHDETEPSRQDNQGDAGTETRSDRIRTALGAAIAIVFILGTLVVAGNAMLHPRPSRVVAPPDGSDLAPGHWKATVSWSDNSVSGAWFRVKNARVQQLTIYQAPRNCNSTLPLVIRTYSNGTRLSSHSSDTGAWVLQADVVSNDNNLLRGTLTPRGTCTVSGELNAWKAQ